MKSVLHVALIAPGGYTNNGLMKAFLDNDFVDYRVFDYQLEKFQYGGEVMNQKLINLAEAHRPELIFLHVQASDILTEETIKKLSSIGFTCLFTYDVRSKEKTEWLYNLAPYLGLVCFACYEDVLECKNRGINNTMVVQSSCDMDVYKYYFFVAKPNFISFVGTNYVNTNLDFDLSDERAEMVQYLEKEYKHFIPYGIGWKNGTLTNPQQEVNIYNTSSIAINHNNFDRELYTSDRLWRIMASGTFCLTKYFKGIETMFENGVHLVWWKNFSELKSYIDYYIENLEERERIATFGSKVVRSKHTWTDRVKEIMTVVGRQITLSVKKCLHAHTINGKIPIDTDEQWECDIPCDCGKLKGFWAECGCPGKQNEMIFRWKQNENY